MADEDTTTQGGAGGDSGGAAQTPPEGKMVPEKDLIAVKRGAEKARTDYEKVIADSKVAMETAAAEAHAVKLNQDAEIERLKGTTNDADNIKVSELQTKLDTNAKDLADKEIKILEYKRKDLINIHKIPAESLEGKTSDQLDSMDEALQAIAKARGGSKLDTGSGGGGQPLTGRALEVNEVAEARTRAGAADPSKA